MTHPHTIDPSRHAAMVTLSGTIRGSDLAAAMETVYNDPLWQPGFSLLWGGTTITELLFEKNDLPRLVDVNRRHAARAGIVREVIIVGRQLDRAMAEMYAMLMKHEGRTVHVCDSEAEAWTWLGHPSTT
jgi:hypothetical protein